MNCKLCQQELEAYLEGRMPEGLKAQVETHLANCVECKTKYQLISIAEKTIKDEKQLEVNPFIATRVMNSIEELEKKEEFRAPAYQKVLKPILIGFSIAVAILIGVLEGGIYKPYHTTGIPSELVYINDAAIESVSMFSKE
jgi:predicted anti-sigma-YlaC factor YlaD